MANVYGTSGNDNPLDGTSGEDHIFGYDGDDYLYGYDDDDYLYGGAGDDYMDGGAGTWDWVDYRYAAGSVTVNLSTGSATGEGTDTITNIENIMGSEYDDNLTGDSGNNWIEGRGGNDTLSGGDGDDYLYGWSGTNTIYGGNGHDWIVSGTGNDTIYGGSGIDIVDYNEATGGVTVNLSTGIATGHGTDSLSSIEQVIGSGLYNDVIIGDGNDNVLSTGGGADTLTGGGGADIIYAGDGDDILNGGTGDDILSGDNGDGAGGDDIYLFSDGDGNDLLQSSLMSARLLQGDDIVEFDNTVTVGSVAYSLYSSEDLLIEYGTGSDSIQVKGFFDEAYEGTLSVEFDNSTVHTHAYIMSLFTGGPIYGTSGNDVINVPNGMNTTVYGDDGDDIIMGNTGDDTLYGEDDDDTLIGGLGNDTIDGGSGVDTVDYSGAASAVTVFLDSGIATGGAGTDSISNVENIMGSSYNDWIEGDDGVNILWGGDGDDEIRAYAGDDILYGGGGNDLLAGWGGNDTMYGGTGDDIFYFIDAGDTIVEYADEGVDEVRTDMTITLASNFENLTLINGYSINGTGNSVDNIIKGNNYSNTLWGMDGNDTLYGGNNNDTLYGGDGNDALYGEQGTDSLYGGDGDDTYYVTDTSDTIVEYNGEGIDTVSSTVSYTLGSYIENLVLTGSASINGTGNSLNNVIIGNSGNNFIHGQNGDDTLYGYDGNDTLIGGHGDDSMYGGDGDDIYDVTSAGDVVYENIDEGHDTVYSSITYTLAANFEDLVLTGSSDVNGTGNSINNYIEGNNGANTLNGGAGDDVIYGYDDNDVIYGGDGNDLISGGLGANTLYGGAGDDIYYTGSSDTVIEYADEGIDEVRVSVNYTLGDHIENLRLVSGYTINGTGNALDNVINGSNMSNTIWGMDGNDIIYGNNRADILYGGDGNDILYGGHSSDTLWGGNGADTFVFEADTAFDYVDTVKDFSTSEGDIIDIADLLSAYDPMTDAITDFVEITTSGSNSVVKVDADGTGGTYSLVQIATLEGITGLTDEAALISAGNLVVA